MLHFKRAVCSAVLHQTEGIPAGMSCKGVLGMSSSEYSGFLGVLAGLTLAGASFAQSVADPTYGTITIGPDLGAMIETVPLFAGGSDDAYDFDTSCVGQINATAPDLVVQIAAPVLRLSVFATSESDLTLVVQRPNGGFLCDDDTDGLNPAVSVLKPSPGEYAVWVGTYGAEIVAANLHLSLQEPDWGAVGTDTFAAQGRELALSPARFHALVAADIPSGGREEIALMAGGADMAADFDMFCTGYIDAQSPDVTLEIAPDTGGLDLRVRSDGDTTLVVRQPDGSLLCDDDSFGVDPALRLESDQPGIYAIWVGTYGADVIDAQLDISRDGASRPEMGHTSLTLAPLTLAPTEDAQAARIGAALLLALDRLVQKNDPAGDLGLELNTASPVFARQENGQIIVEFSDLALWLEDMRFGFGNPRIELRALPDDQLDWAATFPPALEISEGGRAMGRLVWTNSALAGRLNEETGFFPKAEITFSNLEWQPVAGSDTGKFGADGLRLWADFAPVGDGLYTGDAGFELRGMSAFDDDALLSIGRIGLRNALTEGDPGLAMAVSELFAAFTQESEITSALEPILQGQWGRSDATFEIEDISFAMPSGEVYGLERFLIGSGLDGRAEMSSFSMSWALDGLTVEQDDWPEEMGRSDMALSMQLSNLPLRQILGLAATVDTNDPDAYGMLGFQALGMLFAAKPVLEIDDLKLAGGPANITGRGDFRLSGQLSAEGAMDLDVQGFPEVIDMVSRGEFAGQDAQDMLPALLLLRGLGTPTAEGGLSYRIELAPDYSVTVNGLDIASILQ
jgi:hypothetical protein